MGALYTDIIKRIIFNSFGQEPDSNEEKYVYDLLLSRMLGQLRENKKALKTIIGVVFEPTPPDMAMKYLADGLSEQRDLFVITIIKPTVVRAHLKWFSKNINKMNFFVCEEKDFNLLIDLDIVFMPERESPDKRPFPKHVVKVGCQHGIDVQLATTMDDYGGVLEYDYILLGRESAAIPSDHYLDKYPNALINKVSQRVAVIPFGSPKLDRFINSIPDIPSNKKRIVYHLSSLFFEKNRDIILSILDSLLVHFKESEVIFRCFPDEREHPFIKECVSKYQNYDNFIFSVEDSYVSVYATACCMITTFMYEEHLFKLATGLPIIYFNHESGDVKSLPELIRQVSEYINTYKIPTKSDRISTCINEGVFNPGRSLDYLIESISDIKSLKLKESWCTFELYSSNNKIISEEASISYWLSEERSFNGLAVNFINYNEDNNLYRVLAAESFSRKMTRMTSLRDSMLHLAHAIRNSNLDSDVVQESLAWWRKKGKFLFLKVIDMIILNDQEITTNERFLWHYFYNDLCELISTEKAERLNLNYLNYKLRNYETNDILCHSDIIDSVFLYGAGQLAEDFISSRMAIGDERKFIVLDSDEVKQGKTVMGYKINPPSLLSEATPESKVIICSHAFIDDIYDSIVTSYSDVRSIYYIER